MAIEGETMKLPPLIYLKERERERERTCPKGCLPFTRQGTFRTDFARMAPWGLTKLHATSYSDVTNTCETKPCQVKSSPEHTVTLLTEEWRVIFTSLGRRQRALKCATYGNMKHYYNQWINFQVNLLRETDAELWQPVPVMPQIWDKRNVTESHAFMCALQKSKYN